MGFVAGFVETFPQRVVGGTALVGLFPQFAQLAQAFLHLAATERLAVGPLEQGFSAGHQVFAHLVGAPALPAFELSGRHQRGVHLVLQPGVDELAVVFQHGAQRSGRTHAGLAMALGSFFFQLGQGLAHGGDGLVAHFGVHLGFGRTGCRSGSSHFLGRNAAREAHFVGPHTHGRQRCSRVGCGRRGLGQGGTEGVPYHQQLGTRGVQQRRELGIHTHPVGVAGQTGGLVLPVQHVGLQGVHGGLGVGQGFGGEDFGALRQQHSGLALHLHAVLQVFDDLDAIRQLGLEGRQGLARQRCARAGGVTLPGQGIGDVELGQGQQGLGLVGPFRRNGFLALGTLDFVEPLTQGLGSSLVAHAQLLEDLLHLLGCGVAGQPLTHAGGPLTRGGGRERATGQGVQRMHFRGFGRRRGGFGHFGHFVARRKREHESGAQEGGVQDADSTGR